MESVYIHIPFCRNICTYCDFCKMYYNSTWISKYLKSLKNEIEDSYHNELIKTIYIGGGTPSCLATQDLLELFEIIKIFNLHENVEFTFECNLSDINENLLVLLKQNKVNRLSIGIQSFNNEKLEFMNRLANLEDAMHKISLCRRLGFNNINIDLIYGIPNENIKVLKQDLKSIIKLKPDHISTYSLIMEDNTLYGISKINGISDDLDLKMYKMIKKYLKKYKYIHYEISNFALKGKESLHNINYWKNNEYYGFGLGAHGFVLGFRYENTRSLTNYLKGEYRLKQNIISKKENMENELMLGLRLINGINIKEFYKKFNINIQEVFDFNEVIKNKEIIYKKGYIFIPDDKLYIMNEILIKLL